MWQQLYSDLKDSNFTIIAVAMDTPDAARSWIEAAGPAYSCPVDSEHRLADLYNMVNVPQAVWIDEQGRVVRPVESAGAFEGFRQMDRTTFKVPDDALATMQGARRTYVAAIRDWVLNGTASEHAFDSAQAKAHLQLPDARTAEAHARFRLGQVLLQRGREADAEGQFVQARELHPESWNIWRQTAPKDQRGLASGPAFWARVDALGKKRYYPPVDMKGMPP